MAREIKIAAVTNDGLTVTGHFGMAEYYQVITLQDDHIIAQEKRPKPHHTIHPSYEEALHHDHIDMFAPIKDCQVLISGGMRGPAFEHAQENGLQVILTRGSIDEVVGKYISGELSDHPGRGSG